MTVSMFRQLIRSEQARQQFFQDGRVPEFIDQPTPDLELHLKASMLFAKEANRKRQARWPKQSRLGSHSEGAATASHSVKSAIWTT